jgi:hypothetical protein
VDLGHARRPDFDIAPFLPSGIDLLYGFAPVPGTPPVPYIRGSPATGRRQDRPAEHPLPERQSRGAPRRPVLGVQGDLRMHLSA